jgi:hypothetical protein
LRGLGNKGVRFTSAAPQNARVADQLVAEVRKPGGIGTGNPYYDRAAYAGISQTRTTT